MLAGSVTAQGQKGKISGDITDVNGVSLPGVTVLLQRAEDTTAKQYTTSGSSGRFSFTNVNPGRYRSIPPSPVLFSRLLFCKLRVNRLKKW